MTKTKDSTTGERAKATRIKSSVFRANLADITARAHEGERFIIEHYDKATAFFAALAADYVAIDPSRPSRMAASSEGEAITGEPAKAIAKVERYLNARAFMGVETAFIDDQVTGASDGDPVADLWAGDLRTIVGALKAMLAARADAGREVEPVAWAVFATGGRCKGGRKIDRSRKDVEQYGREFYGDGDFEVSPLYAHPASTQPIAVPVSEERVETRPYVLRHPLGQSGGQVVLEFETDGQMNIILAALTAALAVPDKGVQGDQEDMGSRSQPCADANALARTASGNWSYRGWLIGLEPDNQWHATSPNYDASYEGPEDGWVDNGEKVEAATLDDVCGEIDAWIEEHS